MFKLESYITPLLMGYIDKYVKLRTEDFQLSLWGGDAVLSKLDLRLDVIEKALMLPITFKSGFIHELRLHMPWTRLYSEPVVITINTIECIVKLRDSAHNVETGSAHSAFGRRTDSFALKMNKPAIAVDGEEVPPGYIQSLLNKIFHNLNIVVNNLILKFVEDDIVLSLNIKSAECYSVGADWKRAFIDLVFPELVLRRVVDFHDLTLCLDKRNASGKIESYQDPIFYRCSLTCRFYMRYESLSAKLPFITKLNVHCEKLDMSLTDTQLPMFCRLMELCIALYYGTLELPASTAATEMEETIDRNVDHVGESENIEEADQGWAAWAWSFVPQLASDGAMAELTESDGQQSVKKVEQSVFDVGIYVMQASVIFKLSDSVRESSYFGASKMIFRQLMQMAAFGIGLEITMGGCSYFDVHYGITGINLEMSNVEELLKSTDKTQTVTGGRSTFLKLGLDDSTMLEGLQNNYISGSLFDDSSPENCGSSTIYCFDSLNHANIFTEVYVCDRYGAFWLDYLFTATGAINDDEHAPTKQKSVFENLDLKEKSTMTFLFGPAHLIISSHMVNCISKFVRCAQNHDYEPYSKPKTDSYAAQQRRPPTADDVAKLEEHIPTRTIHVSYLRPVITVECACEPRSDVSKKLFASRKLSRRKSKSAGPVDTVPKLSILPGAVIKAERIELQMCSPMYAKSMAKACSLLSSATDHVLYHCHSHLNVQLCDVESSLMYLSGTHTDSCRLIQPFTVVGGTKTLLFPEYWKNALQPRFEQQLELPQLTVQFSLAELLFAAYVGASWLQSNPCPSRFLDLSVMDDVFNRASAGTRTRSSHTVMEMSVSAVSAKRCLTEAAKAVTASVGSVKLSLVGWENGRRSVTPLVVAPIDVRNVHLGEFLTQQCQRPSVTGESLFSLTCQTPETTNIQAPGVLYVKIAGIYACCDLLLHHWLMYLPSLKLAADPASGVDRSEVMVDVGIARATLPITSPTSQGSASESAVTPLASGSRVTSVKPLPVDAESSKDKEDRASVEKKSIEWGNLFADIYPLIKIMEVQVEVKQWCFLLPTSHMKTADSAAIDPLSAVHDVFTARQLSDSIVVCTPEFSLYSSGRMHTDTIADIPVKRVEHAIASEKLPWTAKLENLTMYTIQHSEQMLYLLKPTSLCATLAVSTKYRCMQTDNLTDSLSLLGLCIHADMQTVEMAVSNPQIQLSAGLLSHYLSTATSLYANAVQVMDLYWPMPSHLSSTPNKTTTAVTSASEPIPAVQSFGQLNGSSSFAESPNVLAMPQTMTSESVSLETLSTEGWRSSGVELSMWLQWTLLKFVISMYGTSQENEEMRILAELEDITTYVDVHEVYAKVKSTVGVVGLSSHIQSEHGWQAGSHGGIIVSCGEHVTRNITVFSQKSWRHYSSSLDSRQERHSSDEGRHGFLSIVFTRALKTSTQCRMATSCDADVSNSKSDLDDSTCLNEVCLNVKPCDVVFSGSVLACLRNLFALPAHQSSSQRSPYLEDAALDAHARLPFLTSRSLPLVYVNARDFRLLIPAAEWSVNGRGDAVKLGERRRLPGSGDVCIFHVSSVTVVPHAVNPLARLIVDKTTYSRALHAGVTGRIGSEVEDRQYQMDISGLGVSTGCWKELIMDENSDSSLVTGVKSENPALAWNTLSNVRSVDEVRLIPVLSGFDVRVIFAPAIVSSSKLVCGHSVELNATTDLDLFLSVAQLHLLCDILTSNVSCLINNSHPAASSCCGPRINADTSATLDSGVGSEASLAVCHTVSGKVESSKPRNSSGWDWMESSTFDVLLTAGRISLMLYDHLPASYGTAQDVLADGSIATSGCRDVDYVSGTVEPLLHVLFSQPHSFIVCETTNQNIELSCYDMSVRGPLPTGSMSSSEEPKLLPDPSDFAVYWIETKPGKVDVKTGIPACLYTLRIMNYLSSSASITLDVGRPLKVTASVTRLEHVVNMANRFHNALLPVISLSKPVASAEKAADDDVPASCEVLRQLGWQHHILLCTGQLVVCVDVNEGLQFAGIRLAVSDLKMDTCLQFSDTVPSVNVCMTVNNILLKTSWSSSVTTLCGPLCPTVSLQASWQQHSGAASNPMTVVHVECTSCPLSIGQENILALELITRCAQDFVKMLNVQSSPAAVDVAATAKRQRPVVSDRRTEDDLKSGAYEYITEDSDRSSHVSESEVLPGFGEILFHTDVESGCSSMTWKYREQRIIDRLCVMPVPFSISAEYDMIDHNFQVPCCLQFLNSVQSNSFETYAELFLSESRSSEVMLPELHGTDSDRVFASDTWRVTVSNQLVDRTTGSVVSVEQITESRTREPVISPLALAVSLRVDSSFVADLVPSLQLSVKVGRISCGLINHANYNQCGAPVLKCFKFVERKSQREMLRVIFDNATLTTSVFSGTVSKLRLTVSAHASCDVLEYRNLTMRPVFTDWLITSQVLWHLENEYQPAKMEVEADFGWVQFNIGQGLIHSMNRAVSKWMSIHSVRQQQDPVEYYVICNNTQQTLYFGQANTDECIGLGPGEAYCYCWRTHKIKQSLWIAFSGSSLSSCPAVDIDTKGCTTVSLLHTASGLPRILFVRVQPVNGYQKQVTVSGQLIIGSLLRRTVQVKLIMSDSPYEPIVEIGDQRSSLSHVTDLAAVKAVKIRWKDEETWSSDISLSSYRVGTGHLTKIPSLERTDPVHVWCHVYVQQHKDSPEYLIVFLPLFVVRTQLPTSLLMKVETAKHKSNLCMELAGRGQEKQLHLSGGDVTHTMTFQLSPTMLPSSPVVSLSSDTIDQLCRESVTGPDLVDLWSSWQKNVDAEMWPYNAMELCESYIDSSVYNPSQLASTQHCQVDQPNIDLQVTLTQRWPGLNALLIDVAPYCLLANECDLELTLFEENGGSWRIPAGKTFSPPFFNEESFRVAINLSGQLHMSETVRLRNEDSALSPYRSTSEPLLYYDGHISLDIPITVDGITVQLCCLTLHSTFQHRMRVLTVRERFCIVNKTAFSLEAYCMCLHLSTSKVSMLQNAHGSVRLKSGDSGRAVSQSLLLWNVAEQSEMSETRSSEFSNPTYVQYVSFRLTASASSSSANKDNVLCEPSTCLWSHPVRLRVSAAGKRHTLALPVSSDDGLSSRACCLAVQSDSTIVYLTLADDKFPFIELQNNCDVPLFYGQAATDTAGLEDVTVQEEVELITDLPLVEAHSTALYTPPFLNMKFPELVGSVAAETKLHLAGASHRNAILWSQVIDLDFEHSLFVCIPEVFDVKVSSSKIGHTLRVSISPVNRAEVLAKEIRSRIKSRGSSQPRETFVVKTVASSVEVKKIEPQKNKSALSPKLRQSPVKHAEKRFRRNDLQLSVSCLCRRVDVVILDEQSSVTSVQEFMSVTFETVSILFYPTMDVPHSTTDRIRNLQHVRLSVHNFQIDNLMYGKASYDFPVVMRAKTVHDMATCETKIQLSVTRSLREELDRLATNSLVNVHLELFIGDHNNVVQTVNVAIRPAIICIEDVYISNLLKLIDSLIPRTTKANPSKERRFPTKVSATADLLCCPVCLQRLSIEKIDLMVSVHASLKLYIASDDAPLSLGHFEQTHLCTTAHQLMRVIAMHYATCALYRAGLLVGSLEILGNPTGLVRNIGSGVADMFSMPYRGLTRGPGEFLDGVRRGTGSLLWHLSTGTLTSITNFASSVSRNMERLSFDVDHIRRSEILRRHKPSHVSEGLKNGLSGLGLSILGALAGIADQPLQVFTRAQTADCGTVSGTATGLVSGISKGLIGVVTKPIGGAAEFVSQTSLGLLHHVGVMGDCRHKHQSFELPLSAFHNSLAKYQEKLLSTLPSASVLAVVVTDDKTNGDRTSLPNCCAALVLTQDCVSVFDVHNNDTQLQSFAVADVDCQLLHCTDATHLVFSRHVAAAVVDEDDALVSRERVADFISGVMRTQRNASAAHVDASVVKYEFIVHDDYNADHFFSLFCIVKSVSSGHGFVI